MNRTSAPARALIRAPAGVAIAGRIEARPCRIHRGGVDHQHVATCHACMTPLAAVDLEPLCHHPKEPGYVYWRCLEYLA